MVLIKLLSYIRIMSPIGKNLLLLAVVGFAFTSQAVTPDDRYNTIVERNIFRLTSPPVAPTVPTNNEALDRKIELSGFSLVNGEKKAWFIVQPKANSKDLPLYFTLGEDQAQDFIKVVSISDDFSQEKGEVKIINAGNPMVLSFKQNSPKAVPGAAAPAPAPVAAVNVNTGVVAPQPSVIYNGGGANYGGSYGSSGRPVTVTGGSASPVGAIAQPSEGGLRTIPTRTLRMAPAAEAQIDPVAQRALMEIQQAHAQQTGTPLPPLPPLPQ